MYLNYAHNAVSQSVVHFEEIRIFANGQVIQRFTGVERDKLNQFDGKAGANGVLEIPFDRSYLKTVAGQEETALNTGVADSEGRKITSLYMEIDLGANAVVAPSDLSLYAKESDAIPGGPGIIPYIRREQRNPAGADTDFQISDLVNPGVNAPDKIALNRITFKPSTGEITNIRIDRNSYSIFDRTDQLNRVIQKDGVRVPQGDYFMVDTTENGYGGEPIDLYGMTDFRYRLSVDAGSTLTVLSEYLGVLNG